MTFRDCQRRLFIVWCAGTAVVFLIVFARTMAHWHDDAGGAWAWFSPLLVPSLSLVVASYIATEKNADVQRREPDRAVYLASITGSVGYLSLILVVLLVSGYKVPALPFLNSMSIGLGIAQGAVVGVLGYFFVKSG
jgi:hypothetical protein